MFAIDGTFGDKLPHFTGSFGNPRRLFKQVFGMTALIFDSEDNLLWYGPVGFAYLSGKKGELYKLVTVIYHFVFTSERLLTSVL